MPPFEPAIDDPALDVPAPAAGRASNPSEEVGLPAFDYVAAIGLYALTAPCHPVPGEAEPADAASASPPAGLSVFDVVATIGLSTLADPCCLTDTVEATPTEVRRVLEDAREVAEALGGCPPAVDTDEALAAVLASLTARHSLFPHRDPVTGRWVYDVVWLLDGVWISAATVSVRFGAFVVGTGGLTPESTRRARGLFDLLVRRAGHPPAVRLAALLGSTPARTPRICSGG